MATIEDEYRVLVEARTTGDGDYHSLFQAWIYVHSIFIAAIAILIPKRGLWGATVLVPSLSLAVSVLGAFLAFQMAVALRRFATWLGYLEWQLRHIESQLPYPRKLFTDRFSLFAGLSIEDTSHHPCHYEADWLTRTNHHWWALRSYLTPWAFMIFYLLVAAWSACAIFRYVVVMILDTR